MQKVKQVLVKILAESKANTCFAKIIAKTLNLNTKINHTIVMGRDRVISEAKNIIKNLKDNEKVLLIIDYEKGVSRKFIDKNFEKEAIYEDKIYIGKFKKSNKIIAIIFDSNIEDFLQKITSKHDENIKRLKHGDLDEICKKIEEITKEKLNKVINDITNKLSEFVK